jgi:hypothetical protein
MIPGIIDGSGGKILASTSDDFNRVNSTDITAVGKNWQEVKGDWEIVSNRLAAVSSVSGNPIAILKINNKNATVRVDGVSGTGDGWGVSFWVVDSDNWWSATTNMTQSSVQNPAFSGTQSVFIGNACGGSAGAGAASGPTYNLDSSAPPFAGTCYSICCTSVSPGTAEEGWYYDVYGSACFLTDPNCGPYVSSSFGPGNETCGSTCCCSYVVTTPAGAPTCNGPYICNCCLANGVNDGACPGQCANAGPVPQYQNQQVNYPETRTWTYVMSAPIRKSENGVVTTVSTPSVSFSQNVAATAAASYPTRPTHMIVTTNGEGITLSAPGSAGGTISASITATGANRGKKHGAAIAQASVSQATSVDNFVYTQIP